MLIFCQNIWKNQLLCLFLQTESKDMERNLLIELLEDGDKITGTELFGELSFTIDDEP